MGYKGAKWSSLLHMGRSFQEPRQRQKVICGQSGRKVSLESTQRTAESWKRTVFGTTLRWLLEDRHKPEYKSSVMKQKVISRGMCRGGDIRDMPVVQKEGRKQHSGEGALSSRALLMRRSNRDVSPGLSPLCGLSNHLYFIILSWYL